MYLLYYSFPFASTRVQVRHRYKYCWNNLDRNIRDVNLRRADIYKV